MSPTDIETLAENFAADGRDELISRFRDAYTKALGTQSDLVSFDQASIESMVQHAVSDADGLQWRRAIAGVASRELGIDLGSALVHPAVVRAHQLTGAPTYESALSELAVPVPAPPIPNAPIPPATAGPDAPIPPASAAPGVTSAPESAAKTPTPPAPAADLAPAPVPAVEPEPEPVAGEPEPVAAEPVAADPEPEPIAADPVAADPKPEAESVAVEPIAAEPDDEVEPEPAVVIPPAASAVPELELPQPVAEPEPDPVAESAQPEPEAEAGPEAEAEPEPGTDQSTVAYDIPRSISSDPADAPPPEEDLEFLEEPSGDQLVHRADEFAEEFLAESPQPAAADAQGGDYTYEHELVTDEPLAGDFVEFTAVHLGGVATLPSAEEIHIRLSEEGLDLLLTEGDIVGRLTWFDIAAMEVTVPHGRRRRRGAPRLVVHTEGGSARFEVPELSGEELQEQVQPLMERFGH